MGFQYQELTISDFSGGISDKTVNMPLNKLQNADNFLIDETGTALELRDGSNIYIDGMAGVKLSGLFDFNFGLLANRGSEFYFIFLDTLTNVIKPNGGPAFIESGDNVYAYLSKIGNQGVLTNSGTPGSYPVAPGVGELLNKPLVAMTQSGITRIVEAGLPVPEIEDTVFVGNVIPDYQGVAGVNPFYRYSFVFKYEYTVNDVKYRVNSPVSSQEVWGINDIGGSLNKITITNLPSVSPIGNQIDTLNVVLQIYRTTSNGDVAKLIGEVVNGTTTFEDSIRDEDLVDFGKTFLVESFNSPPAIGVFTAYDLGGGGNSVLGVNDAGNGLLEAIYTAGNRPYWGTVIATEPGKTYKVTYTQSHIGGTNGNVTFRAQDGSHLIDGTDTEATPNLAFITDNGNDTFTTTFKAKSLQTTLNFNLNQLDTWRIDDVIVTEAGETLYTDGGSVEHFPAPKAKYSTVVNSLTWYAYCETLDIPDSDTTPEVNPYRVYQSLPNNPHSVGPLSFFEVDDVITGIGNVNNFPVVFTKTQIYRIESAFDSVVTGVSSPRKKVISDTVGCVSHGSIIRVNDVLVFIAETGVYQTNGYDVKRIPATDTMYDIIRSFTSNTADGGLKINSTYDFQRQRVYWSFGAGDVDNDRWLILDVRTGGFTTCSGLGNFNSSALAFYQNSIYRGDKFGYIHNHDDAFLADQIVDITKPVADWQSIHIPFNLKTVAIDYGSPSSRKWVSELSVLISSEINFAMKPTSNNDDNKTVSDLKFIKRVGAFYWGWEEFVWGDDDIAWKVTELKSSKRHFPRGSMRCRHKQIGLEPAETIIYKSDNYGEADVTYVVPADPSFSYVDLTGGGTWPDDVENYKISFEEEQYSTGYFVEERVSDTRIRVGMPSITQGANKKWQIEGKLKQQRFTVKALTSRFAPLDNQGTQYDSREAGGNQ